MKIIDRLHDLALTFLAWLARPDDEMPGDIMRGYCDTHPIPIRPDVPAPPDTSDIHPMDAGPHI